MSTFFYYRIHVVIVVFAVSILSVVIPSVSLAQCDSTFQAIEEAGYVEAAVLADGTIDTLNVRPLDADGPDYVFYTASDSSKLRFKFGEFMKNRRKLFLSHWCVGRTVNWSDSLHMPIHEWTPEELRDRSKLRDFSVNPGDTIQFYRAVWWIDRLHNTVLASRYINPDPVSYSVAFERADGTHRAIIDTMLFGSTTPDSRPCIFSWYPMLARVRYVIPSTMDSNSIVRLRFNMYHHGVPEKPFVRNDVWDAWESNLHLGNTLWRAWNDSVVAAQHCAAQTSCDILVTSATMPSRITFSTAAATTIDHVSIVTTSGATVWSSEGPIPA
ncbi:MAG: hypothetical protein MUC47_11605, partial [Candidatus Kapabacteria bacterium]|nr:hypothetical protein [Candidatus Kapabacteria bacterium]